MPYICRYPFLLMVTSLMMSGGQSIPTLFGQMQSFWWYILVGSYKSPCPCGVPMFHAQNPHVWCPTLQLCWIRGFERDSNPFNSQWYTCVVDWNHNSPFMSYDRQLKPLPKFQDKLAKSSQIPGENTNRISPNSPLESPTKTTPKISQLDLALRRAGPRLWADCEIWTCDGSHGILMEVSWELKGCSWDVHGSLLGWQWDLNEMFHDILSVV